MLSLILFRHGKSDWDRPFASDHERPLAARGEAAARCMGRFLARSDQVPDLAISSSAVRARETLKLAAASGGWDCPIRIESTLYETAPSAVLNWLQGFEERPARLLLTGHEPTWSDLAGRLIGGALIRVPTGAMLRIDFDREHWSEIDFGEAELRWLMPPKVVCRLKGMA